MYLNRKQNNPFQCSIVFNDVIRFDDHLLKIMDLQATIWGVTEKFGMFS